MAHTEERLINGIMTLVTVFDHSAQEIDDATDGVPDGGAAPAGFGLGTDAVLTLDKDANNIVANGLYYCDKNTPTGADWVGIHIQRNDRFAWQLFRTTNGIGHSFATRNKDSNESPDWGAWEWVNPPMIPGIEYRTVERWNGKSVYKKMIDFGALPNATQKEVSIGALAKFASIDLSKSIAYSTTGGIVGTNRIPFNALNFDRVVVNENSISITTKTDMSSVSAYILVNYTKD